MSCDQKINGGMGNISIHNWNVEHNGVCYCGSRIVKYEENYCSKCGHKLKK